MLTTYKNTSYAKHTNAVLRTVTHFTRQCFLIDPTRCTGGSAHFCNRALSCGAHAPRSKVGDCEQFWLAIGGPSKSSLVPVATMPMLEYGLQLRTRGDLSRDSI